MKKLWGYIVVLLLISCGQDKLKDRELNLRERELVIKERELALKERELSLNEHDKVIVDSILHGDGKHKSIKTHKSSIVHTKTDILKFILKQGESNNGFYFSQNGELLYQGNSLSPKLTLNVKYISKVYIEILKENNFAGIIAVDIDGQNSLFFLDLDEMSSTKVHSNSWNAAQQLFWSPSRYYMLAWCVYEGESFFRIDTRTKKFISMGVLKPGNNYTTRWKLTNEPTWMDSKDILTFNVGEFCNPYEVDDCGETLKIPIAKYKVHLNPINLSIIDQKLLSD